MKKRLFGTLLMGAMFIASMSMFTSCKDYDDDINSNKDAITELQKTAADLQSKLQTLENKHNEDIGKLNTAIQALQNEAATHATKVELQTAVSALEKSIADLTAIAATKEALQAVNDALEAKKADKTALEELQKTLAAADAAIQLDIEGIKKVDNDQNIAIAAAQKQLEDQQKAIDELKKALEGKASVEDLNKLAKTVQGNSDAIAALQKKLDGIENVKKYIDDADAKLKTDLQKYATDADSKLKDELVKLMNDADNKVRTDIGKDIATLTLYIDQILNSIVLRPQNYIDGIEAIDVPMLVYQDLLFINNDKLLARGAAGESWNPKNGKNVGTPTDIHWINGLAGLIPNMTYIWNKEYGTGAYNVLDPGISAITGHQYIHILPAEGAEFDQYESYESYQAHVLYNVNPNSPDLDGATFSFDVNYADVTLATPSTKAMGDDALIYPVNPDASSYNISAGVMDVPFRVNLSEFINFYAKELADARMDYEGSTADGRIEQYLHLNEQTLTAPFAAATITKVGNSGVQRSINSDWGVITPSFLQLIALADNNPDVVIAPAWGVLDRSKVTQNHLYETAAQAIAGQATHEVQFDETLDLKPFIETHAAKFGTAFSRDAVLKESVMEEMGLEYRYEFVDYQDNLYKTEQSKHADPAAIANGIVDPCGVDAVKGEPDASQPVAYASIGREPLVRVRLVHINSKTGAEQTLLVGYVKVRIVEKKTEIFEQDVTIQDDVYMNCPGIVALKWYQIENYVYEKMGMSKATFDATYELDRSAVWQDTGNRYIKVAGNWVNEADYVKTLANQYMNTDMSLEELIGANLDFATKYFSAFAGIVGYTNDALWDTYGYAADPEQTQSNVIYWALGVPYSAHAHAFADGSTLDAETDLKYVEYLTKPDASGNSTVDLTTTVRFVRKTDKTAPLYVTLTIPAGKLHWATSQLTNKRPAYWYERNTNTNITAESDMKKVQEVHINVPQPRRAPATNVYDKLVETDFAANLLDNFTDLTVKWTIGNGKYSVFDKMAKGTDQGNVEFWLTIPVKGVNAESGVSVKTYKGHPANTWTVIGYSGKTYTLAIAKSDDGGKTFYTSEIVKKIANVELDGEVKHLVGEDVALTRGNYIIDVNNNVAIVSLLDTKPTLTAALESDLYVTRTKDAVQNEYIRYFENEQAEDILNYKGRVRPGNVASAKEFGEKEIFTAYLYVGYNGACYEALDVDNTNYFNARFERPVNFYPITVSTKVDAANNVIIDFSQFIYTWGTWNSNKSNGIINSAFTDWRGHYLVPEKFFDNTVAGKNPQTNLTPYDKTEYYTIALDGPKGTAYVNGGGEWTDAQEPKAADASQWKFTEDLLKLIKTDYDDITRTALDGATADGRKAIEGKKVAAIKYGGSLDLQVNASGDLQYHNNAGNVGVFHIYVPIYWSYVLGDEYNKFTYKWFRSGNRTWGVITIDTTIGY